MLGMLIVISAATGSPELRASRANWTYFFGDVRCGAANLDVGSVGLEHPRHRFWPRRLIIIVVVMFVIVRLRIRLLLF